LSPLAERWLILALIALAGATAWWLWRLHERILGGPPPLRPELDYILEDFELSAYNERGANSFRLEAPRLERLADGGQLRIQAPRIAMRDGRGRRWLGQAAAGEVSPKGEEVRLLGGVALERAAADSEALVLRSEALTLFTETRRMETDAWVTIEQPGSILRGRGLIAELDADRLQLLADVHATFQPAGR
jgi:lipopolysaccharide export system protein LptC